MNIKKAETLYILIIAIFFSAIVVFILKGILLKKEIAKSDRIITLDTGTENISDKEWEQVGTVTPREANQSAEQPRAPEKEAVIPKPTPEKIPEYTFKKQEASKAFLSIENKNLLPYTKDNFLPYDYVPENLIQIPLQWTYKE